MAADHDLWRRFNTLGYLSDRPRLTQRGAVLFAVPINRSGDRQLNRVLHTITLIRMRLDTDTKAYVARRTAEGKTSRDAQRCLKRAICRQLFKLLERTDQNGRHSHADLPQAA
ncbi:hypothetical protein ACFWVC_00960 [Streptomyces sp. NPDC058691]|uniref:hypothetical protein n=1 Tax=Streptomyces sp. NPDC058691 TaxID=3346601 RepID=UPI0036572E61